MCEFMMNSYGFVYLFVSLSTWKNTQIIRNMSMSNPGEKSKNKTKKQLKNKAAWKPSLCKATVSLI